MIRMWWCLIDRSLDYEMTMPLRVPSELSDSLYICIFVSSFDDGLDGDDNVLLSFLSFFLFSGCLLQLNFLFCFFFLVVFTNYLREPRKELYSSPSGCKSKPGRRRGNGGPSNSGLNRGRCGWKKRNTKHKLSCESQINKYEEMFTWILINNNK